MVHHEREYSRYSALHQSSINQVVLSANIMDGARISDSMTSNRNSDSWINSDECKSNTDIKDVVSLNSDQGIFWSYYHDFVKKS